MAGVSREAGSDRVGAELLGCCSRVVLVVARPGTGLAADVTPDCFSTSAGTGCFDNLSVAGAAALTAAGCFDTALVVGALASDCFDAFSGAALGCFDSFLGSAAL